MFIGLFELTDVQSDVLDGTVMDPLDKTMMGSLVVVASANGSGIQAMLEVFESGTSL